MNWRKKLYEFMFVGETQNARKFDIFLLGVIIFSIIVVMLESIHELRESYGTELQIIEWFFTIIFTLELTLRLISTPSPRKYLLSFYGIIDIISILPSYLILFIPGSQSLMVVRIFRLLRVFRIFKFARYSRAIRILTQSITASWSKLAIFLFTIIALSLIMGTIMYIVEGEENGFTSIPLAIYWAITTMTTVGYGDLIPHTHTGQFIASVAMLLGYAIIAIPTGIISSEIAEVTKNIRTPLYCEKCFHEIHYEGSTYCSRCAHKLSPCRRSNIRPKH